MKLRTYFLLLGGILLLGIFTGGLFSRLVRLPDVTQLENFQPSQASRILADDGTVIEELFLEKREVVPFARIPEFLRQAVIAVEDSRFYFHHGIDFRGVARALIRDIAAGRIIEGGSTITQQLSKVLFFSSKRTLIRKIKEAILTLQIEQHYTKDQILNFYLNQIYLGSGCYGVQTASEKYFGKKISKISLAEAALLAGLPKSPERYSPLTHPEAARRRRNLVLERMVVEGYITRKEAEQARAEPIPDRRNGDYGNRAPYFVESVVRKVAERFGRKELYEGGLTLHTTLNVRIQKIAQKALQEGLNKIEARRTPPAIEPLQGAVIVLNPRTGAIEAMVGGRSYAVSQFNRAVQAKRQPGSAFKPLIFAAALRSGHKLSDLLMDLPITCTDADTGKSWTPQNFEHVFHGPVTLRYALERSLNVPTVRLLREIGFTPVINLAHKLGIESPLKPYLSLALGTSEVSLMELTSAYATFAAEGIYSRPHFLTRIYDSEGHLLKEHRPEQSVAVDEQTAFLITYLLEGVTQSGTGRIARSLNRPVAVKTGTTDNYSDAWFIGYTPELAAGIWVGYDDRQSIGPGETGARAAGPIFVALLQGALKNHAPSYFPVPKGIVFRRIDAKTGEPATEKTKEVIEEAFRKSPPHR
ncbi:MAG: PBP1A family penicillin-binding protein [Deltaproteobacteria bacterium]|nr:PBP1A family penicillin-binding protein [Deltaproteobacteria bacterium]